MKIDRKTGSLYILFFLI